MRYIGFRGFFGFMVVVGLLILVPVCYELWHVLYSPKPDFKVTVGLVDDADAVECGIPLGSAILLTLTCETPKSFLPGYSIHTTVFFDGTEVEVIPYMTSGNIYPKKEGLGRGPVGTGISIPLPEHFLVDGEHTLTVKSFQRRGKFLFIFGTFREKTDEYKMVVFEGAIVTLESVDVGDI